MIVVDASIAIKWTVDEIGHDAAVALLSQAPGVAAPDLLIPETTNVLRTKVKRSEISVEHAINAAAFIVDAIDEILPSAEIAPLAMSLAVQIDHAAYDCFYLASALSSSTTPVTADRRFCEKCWTKGYTQAVIAAPDQWLSHPGTVGEEEIDDLSRLSGKVEETLQALRDLHGGPLGETGIKFVDSRDVRPVFDSPAYRALCSRLVEMPRDDLVTVLALAWFGRGHERDWVALQSRATQFLSHGAEEHLAYLISQMRYVEAGAKSWREFYATRADDSR